MSLIESKETLKRQITKILYNAYMSQYAPNKLESVQMFDVQIKNLFHTSAEKFAHTAAEPTVDAIYEFLKQITITINPSTIIAPAAPPTIPMGPCNGIISNVTIS